MADLHDDQDPDQPRRLVHHAPLKRWSPVTREERKATRTFVERLTDFPYLTVGVSVFLCWAYLVQLVVGWPFTMFLPPAAGGEALVADILGDRLGWLDGQAVLAGEGWRLLSCTMLHGSLLHVAGNSLVLFFLGRLVENMYGRAAFIVTYVGAGASGALLSMTVSGGPSLGASGAILGMLGATWVLGIKHRKDIPKPLRDYFGTDMWVFVILIAALSLLPFVDWAGHLGGFAWGVLIGLVWPARLIVGPPPESFRKASTLLTGLAIGSFLFCVAVVADRTMNVGDALPHDDLRGLYAAVERGDDEAVRRLAIRLEERFGDRPELQPYLGVLFSSVGEYERSLQMYRAFEQEAGRLALNDTWQNDMAWLLFIAWPDDADRVDEGMGRVRTALKVDPKDDAMRNTLAYGLVLDGDFAEGEELSGELMEGRRDEQIDVYIHVLALIGLGRDDEARDEFLQYAPEFPADPGLAMRDIGRIKDRAEAQLRAKGLLDG